ncbi:MAG: family 10 glycosylhydrolase [Armatimonadota bacterium]|nr:family 10 glycosylhydrolase [Armatimonadota bacterium]
MDRRQAHIQNSLRALGLRQSKLCLTAVLVCLFTAGCTSAQSEFRGAWITAWTSGFFTQEEIDATVAAAKKAGITALFVQVRKNGDAYYNSETEPKGSGIAPDFDPLAAIIKKAHAEGIEVHAWINTLRMWSSGTPSDPKHIAVRHPEWVNKDKDGNTRASEGLYLDPGIPQARDYVASVVEEIVRNYDVDGIHLDYIRYPGKNWGYSDLALEQYRSETNTTAKPATDDPKWLQWKRDQVTRLVAEIRKRVKAVKPKVVISASTIAWGDCPSEFSASSPFAVVCQDWKRWMEEGLLDANCPMNYKDEANPKQAAAFRNWLSGFKKWSGGKPTYVGIDVHTNTVPNTLKQIQAVRQSKLDGFVLFSFNASKKREMIVEALAKTNGLQVTAMRATRRQ